MTQVVTYPNQVYPAQGQQQVYPPQGQQQVQYVQQPVVATVITQPPVHTGNCPACHVGNVVDYYPLMAWLLAIVFFPFGILCCLAMKQKKCTHCRAMY